MLLVLSFLPNIVMFLVYCYYRSKGKPYFLLNKEYSGFIFTFVEIYRLYLAIHIYIMYRNIIFKRQEP